MTLEKEPWNKPKLRVDQSIHELRWPWIKRSVNLWHVKTFTNELVSLFSMIVCKYVLQCNLLYNLVLFHIYVIHDGTVFWAFKYLLEKFVQILNFNQRSRASKILTSAKMDLIKNLNWFCVEGL